MNCSFPPKRRYLAHTIGAAMVALAVAGCDGSNDAPFANAGPAQNVTSGATISLDASASTDPNGDTLSYAWTLVSRPEGSTAALVGPNTARPGFTPDLPGTYVASVVVSDGASTSNPATVTVTASDVVAFNALITPMPQSYPSWGFEALSIASVGDHMALGASDPNTLAGFVVGMSSWACETGTWTSGCNTTPGSTFQYPMSVNFYSMTGQLLATKTQTFTMPYRPSPDPTCADATNWRRTDGVCTGGLAFHVRFDLRSLKAAVPDSFYYELTMNTRTAGPAPTGVNGPADWMNVGVYNAGVNPPSVGTDPTPGSHRWNGANDTDVNAPQVQLVMAAP
ncbi:MAG: PKD domain-containing protein [Pseudomonadota bacterium]